MEKLKIFKILLKHKLKYFKQNSKIVINHSKSKNEFYLGIKLVYKFLITELIFLKEKNQSAKEQNYWQINYTERNVPRTNHYEYEYEFQFMDAFSPNINLWKKFFRINNLYKKNLNYLEIGAFEGRSSVFVLENLPLAICDFVDPFEEYSEMTDSTNQTNFELIYKNFMNNIEKFNNRTSVHVENSDSFFKVNNNYYDLVYVDGSHFGEDVYKDAYFRIKESLKKENKKIDMVVLLMANAGTVNSSLIKKGISMLKKNKRLDSAVSTSVYNMWSPVRARRLNKRGFLEPFVPFKKYSKKIKISCDRDSQGDVFYADMSVSVVRPKCLENMNKGLLPQKWMGKRIGAIKSIGGFDLDFEWQLPILEYWIKKYGKK